MIRFVTLVAALLLSTAAVAKPPPNTDLYGTTHIWFESLVSKTGIHCCSEADCHVLTADEWRRDDEGYEIKIFDKWKRVRDDQLTEQPSIFSAPVGCWSIVGNLYCFSRPVDM